MLRVLRAQVHSAWLRGARPERVQQQMHRQVRPAAGWRRAKASAWRVPLGSSPR